MRYKAYEGPEKYIFVSYAHKDSDQVLHILDRLAQKGYRVWYDDGIAPGSEWPENIAQHLDGCALVIAFVSNNSIASSNCRREVTFALAKQKPFLGILLEPTTMSLGMELQLSAQQCILRYNYRREEDFLEKIYSCPDLAPCLEIPEQPGTAEETGLEVTASTSAVLTQAEPKQLRPKKAKPPKVKQEPGPKPPKKAKTLLFGGIAAAAVLVAALLVSLLFAKVEVAPGVKVERDALSVTLQKAQIDEHTVSQLNKLKELRSLSISDSAVDEDVLGGLKSPQLRTLTLRNCSGIGSFAFLGTFPELKSLTLSGSGVTNESFAGLALPALTEIDLQNNPGFSDLSLLPVASLQNVYLGSTSISDLTPLAQGQELRRVFAPDTQVSSLAPLAGLQNLRVIDFTGCRIQAVTEEFLSLSMDQIWLSGNGLTDLSGFQNFTVLTHADLSGNALEDISWLTKSTGTLVEAYVGDNPLDTSDLAFLADAENLQSLSLNGLALNDLSLVERLTLLEYLSAMECGLTSLAGLNNKTKLKELYLSGNQLQSLASLPTVWENNRIILDLADNQLTSMEGLPQGRYTVLALQGNPLVYTADSFSGMAGNHLIISWEEGLFSCGKLTDFYNVYVLDAPIDRQLALEEALGYTAEMRSSQEIPKILEECGLTR